MSEHDAVDFSREQFLDDVRRRRVREVAMTRLNSLFHRPRSIRIILQKFFVMIGFDDERLDLAQAFYNHFCRVAEIGDETETTRARVTGKTKGIDSVVWHGEGLDGHIADGELGPGAQDSPVAMVVATYIAPTRLGTERGAINRHLQFATKNFESANMIAVLVRKKDTIELAWRDPALREAQHQLSRAQTAIDENLAMLRCNQCAVSRAPAAKHRQTEHGS